VLAAFVMLFFALFGIPVWQALPACLIWAVSWFFLKR
jgi:hypothetical protein